jgi:hypothetical protein
MQPVQPETGLPGYPQCFGVNPCVPRSLSVLCVYYMYARYCLHTCTTTTQGLGKVHQKLWKKGITSGRETECGGVVCQRETDVRMVSASYS